MFEGKHHHRSYLRTVGCNDNVKLFKELGVFLSCRRFVGGYLNLNKYWVYNSFATKRYLLLIIHKLSFSLYHYHSFFLYVILGFVSYGLMIATRKVRKLAPQELENKIDNFKWINTQTDPSTIRILRDQESTSPTFFRKFFIHKNNLFTIGLSCCSLSREASALFSPT